MVARKCRATAYLPHIDAACTKSRPACHLMMGIISITRRQNGCCIHKAFGAPQCK